MKISIFGLGYVGAVSLACLSRDGHHVIGVDIDRSKLDLIASGKTPVVEEGMVELMQQVAASGRVSVTTDSEQAVLDSELSLVCVGTPSAANGSQDQGAILALAASMGRALRKKSTPHVVVFRSTLVPGTVEDVLRPIIEDASGKKTAWTSTCVSSPSFCVKVLPSATTTSRLSPSWVPTIRKRLIDCANCLVTCPASSWKPRCAAPK